MAHCKIGPSSCHDCAMEVREHPLPELPVGILHRGAFWCLSCDPTDGKGAAIYRINVQPYSARCKGCGTICVEPRTPAWPDLFASVSVDPHKKCYDYALESFFVRGNPFEVCGCIQPGDLARVLHDYIKEAHETDLEQAEIISNHLTDTEGEKT